MVRKKNPPHNPFASGANKAKGEKKKSSEKKHLIEEIVRLRSLGHTQVEMASILDVSRSTITRIWPETLEFASAAYFGDETYTVTNTKGVVANSNSVDLGLKEFEHTINAAFPIFVVNNGRVLYQFRENVVITTHDAQQFTQGFHSLAIHRNFSKWLSMVKQDDIASEQNFISWGTYLQHLQQQSSSYLDNWLAKIIEKTDIEYREQFAFGYKQQINLIRNRIFREMWVQVFGEKHILYKEIKMLLDKRPNYNMNSIQEIITPYGDIYGEEFEDLWDPLYFKMLTINSQQSQRMIPNDMKNIDSGNFLPIVLNIIYGGSEEDCVKMVETGIYDLKKLKLVIDGGFKKKGDIDFAENGGFKTMKEVRKARKIKCTTMKEISIVEENGWGDGEVYRTAIKLGFKNKECALYNSTIIGIPGVTWDKISLKWARNATESQINRLSEFSSIRAMDFYDFLFTVEEEIYRTDRLLKEYNKIKSPGINIKNEDDFETFLNEQPFPDVVKVTQGGLTNILINSESKVKHTIHSRVNPSEYPYLKKTQTKLAKELKVALEHNNLHGATLDSFSWLTEALRTHLKLSSKDELLIIDETEKLLGLNKTGVNTLHKIRLARIWIAHKDSEQREEPKWSYIELLLDYTEQIRGLDS